MTIDRCGEVNRTAAQPRPADATPTPDVKPAQPAPTAVVEKTQDTIELSKQATEAVQDSSHTTGDDKEAKCDTKTDKPPVATSDTKTDPQADVKSDPKKTDPQPKADPATSVKSGNAGGSSVQDYLLGLIKNGTPPDQAAKMANQQFGLKTGGEAVYYPDTNTIGLPEFYLAGPTNKPDSPKEWGAVQRNKGGGGGGDVSGMSNSPGTGGGSAVQDYLLGLVKNGTPPDQAAKMANQQFGLKTGGEAVYYPDTNTIGLPGFYLAGPTNKPDSPKEWGVVQRSGGEGGGGGADVSTTGLAGWSQQDQDAYRGLLSQIMGMFGSGGMSGTGGAGQASSDPAVQKIVQQITAQGGHVMLADKGFVLADMNDGMGPQWIPVPRPDQQGQQNQAFAGASNFGWF